MLLPSERPVPPLWGFNGPSQQARGGEPLVDKVNLRWSAIRGQTRVGQPTWWGCRVGGTSSYNPLNKADHLL